MWHHHDVLVFGKGRVATRFRHETVKPGPGEVPALDCRNQRILINKRSARGVHQDTAARHKCDPFGVHHSRRLGRCGAVERQEIRDGQEAFKCLVIGGPHFRVGREPLTVVVVNLHIEAACLFRKRAPDSAHPDDAEPRTSDLLAHHEGGRPAVPRPGSDDPVALHRAPRSPQHQHEGKFGRGIVQHIGRVGDSDVACFQRGQVAVVGSHRMVRDDLQTGVEAAGDLGCELFGMAGDHAIRPGAHPQDFFGGARRVRFLQNDVIVPPCPHQCRVGEMARYPDDGPCHQSLGPFLLDVIKS